MAYATQLPTDSDITSYNQGFWAHNILDKPIPDIVKETVFVKKCDTSDVMH